MTINWVSNLYAQERNILTISGFSAGAHNVVIETTIPSGYTARYILPNSGTLKVDMSDIVRIAISGSFTITEYNEAGTALSASVTRGWSTLGKISPLSLIIPESPLFSQLSMELAIMPPDMILEPISSGNPLQCEMYSAHGYNFATGRMKFLPSGNIVNFARTMEIPSNTNIMEFWHLNEGSVYTIPIMELECDKKYVMVEWISCTGIVRRHTFEIVKVTSEVTEQVEIETLTNQYDVRKNRRDEFSLRLENLTAYDLWYYSDVIFSSDVKVTLDGTNWYQVQVTSKKQTLPETNAGKLNTLEIPLNFRLYDTL